MRRHHGRARTGALATVASIAALLVAVWQGVGNALDGAVGDGEVTGKITGAVGDTSALSGDTSSATATDSGGTSSQELATGPTSDGTNASNEAGSDPGGSRASAFLVQLFLGGQELVTVNRTDAQIQGDGHASGDVVLLSVLGQEIIGADSDSRSGPQSSQLAFLGPLCAGTENQVCAGLLFADTESTESGGTSESDSTGLLAGACIGGSDEDPGDCDGPVGIGVGYSRSQVKRSANGDQDASAQSYLLDACAGPEGDVDGTCSGIGAEILKASTQSSWDNSEQDGDSSGSSSLLRLELGGTEVLNASEEQSVEVPPGCAPGVVCVFVNQHQVTVGGQGAGGREETVETQVLPGAADGEDLVLGHFGVADTSVAGPRTKVLGERGPGGQGVGGGGGGQLAFTGAGILPAAALSLILAGAGALALAWGRRRARLG